MHYCASSCLRAGPGYCKRNQPMLLKIGVMTGPTNEKNRLTSGGELVPDTDPDHFSTSPQHCRVEHFIRYIIIDTGRFSQNLAKWPMPTTEWIHILGAILKTHRSGSTQVQIPYHLWLRSEAMVEVCCHWVLSSLMFVFWIYCDYYF